MEPLHVQRVLEKHSWNCLHCFYSDWSLQCFFTKCGLSYGQFDLFLVLVPACVVHLVSCCRVLLCSLGLLSEFPIGGTDEFLCSSYLSGMSPLASSKRSNGGGTCCLAHAASWFEFSASLPALSQTQALSSLLKLFHFDLATTAFCGPPQLRLPSASSPTKHAQGIFQKPALPLCLFPCWEAEEVTTYKRNHRLHTLWTDC